MDSMLYYSVTMPDLTITSSRQQIFSPQDFFVSLKKDIAEAKSWIIIRSFLFRNDKAGLLVAQALNGAAEKGVKILIIKDRMGALFEYAEQSGQSFLHDEPLEDRIIGPHSLVPIYRYGKFMRKFYGLKPSKLNKNSYRDLLVHKNITLIDQYKINDHSKAIIIDGNIGYTGGVNFGEEYFPPQNWLDFMLRVEGEESLKLLYSPDASLLDEEQLDFLMKTKESVTVIMAFMSNVSYLHGLINLVKSGRRVNLITSKFPSSNRYSNSRFLRLLAAKTKGHRENLTVCLKAGMVHSKVLVRDQNTARIGSQNMCVERGAYNETVAETDNPNVIKFLLEGAKPDPLKDVVLTGESIPRINEFFPSSHIIPAYLEQLGKAVQLWNEKRGKTEIGRARKICEEEIGKFIKNHSYGKIPT
jgi:cardiolipin synthase A/B